MIIKDDRGWILNLGRSSGSSGHHPTLQRCIEQDARYGFEFFVED
jgi:hypothetical protein